MRLRRPRSLPAACFRRALAGECGGRGARGWVRGGARRQSGGIGGRVNCNSPWRASPPLSPISGFSGLRVSRLRSQVSGQARAMRVPQLYFMGTSGGTSWHAARRAARRRAGTTAARTWQERRGALGRSAEGSGRRRERRAGRADGRAGGRAGDPVDKALRFAVLLLYILTFCGSAALRLCGSAARAIVDTWGARPSPAQASAPRRSRRVRAPPLAPSSPRPVFVAPGSVDSFQDRKHL